MENENVLEVEKFLNSTFIEQDRKQNIYISLNKFLFIYMCLCYDNESSFINTLQMLRNSVKNVLTYSIYFYEFKTFILFYSMLSSSGCDSPSFLHGSFV